MREKGGGVQICRKIRGLGSRESSMHQGASTQPSPHIFLHICTSKTPAQIMRRWRKCNRDGGYNPFWWPFLRITLAFCLEICPFPSPPENVSKRGRSVHYSGFWMHTWPGQLRWESAPNPARNKCAHLFSFAPRSAPSYPGHAAGVTLNISSSQQHTRTPR